jgi:hypothetical protein
MWFMLDFLGIGCIIVIYLIIVFITSTTNIIILAEPEFYPKLYDFFNTSLSSYSLMNLLNLGFWNILMLLVTLCHIKCVFSDPGTIQHGYTTLNLELLPSKIDSFGIKDSDEEEDNEDSQTASIPHKKSLKESTEASKSEKKNGKEEKKEEKLGKEEEKEKGDANIIMEEEVDWGNGGTGEDGDLRIRKKDNLEKGLERREEQLPLLRRNRSRKMKEKRNTLRHKINILYELFSRKCHICNCVKPPRTHHCSVCKRYLFIHSFLMYSYCRCIARMDHHCPWINNCVGFSNQKPFVLFLAYVLIASLYIFLLYSYKGIYFFSTSNNYTSHFNLDLVIGSQVS